MHFEFGCLLLVWSFSAYNVLLSQFDGFYPDFILGLNCGTLIEARKARGTTDNNTTPSYTLILAIELNRMN